jgi:hypothetical protein
MATFQPQMHGLRSQRVRPLLPWPALAPIDKAPAPKPLVMGRPVEPSRPMAKVRTRWQPGSMPTFPIEPANDPVRRAADNERAGLTLLTLVLCVTASVALLGLGLQILQ